jgi:sugar O-acyltransferase (sialic acid O-acetyltransferase NeuD family)
MKLNIWIVGAGGAGLDILYWVNDWRDTQDDNVVISGFVDNKYANKNTNMDRYGDTTQKLSIISTKSSMPGAKDRYICAFGFPKDKIRFSSVMLNKGASFITLVHPTSYVAGNSKISIGGVICPNAVIAPNVRVGKFTTIGIHASVGHDAIIGNYCEISPGARISGRVEVGDEVLIGSNAVILPGLKIGSGAVVGAGSVVIADVKSGETVLGNPSKVVWRKK